MKNTNLRRIVSSAIATAMFTVATFLIGSTQAEREASPNPEIQNPKLVSSGVEFSLKPIDARTLKAGVKPAFELTARNTKAELAKASVRMAMTATPPVSKVSRIVPASQEFWSQDELITLKPNETKTIRVEANSQLPTNQMVSVQLENLAVIKQLANVNRNDKQIHPIDEPVSVVAMNFSTK